MKRIIVYPGQIPTDAMFLATNQNGMVGQGFLNQAVLGTGTRVDGLACTPTTPASLSVLVAPGSIYSLENLESTDYGTIAADTTDQIVKQGIVLGKTTFTCPAPTTSGNSVVYLVQAQYEDVDGGSTVLPYYNASDPSVPYSGPSNSGVTQNTIRDGVCVLALKTGVSATTGTQVTPTPDAGFTALWAITVANGATTITSGNIAQVSGAPFLGVKLGDLGTAATKAVTDNTRAEVVSLGTGSVTVGNLAVFQSGSGNIADVGIAPFFHGQCQMTKSGSNLLLSPRNGSWLVIQGQPNSIPSGGVTLAPTSLSAATLYYIYAFMNSGTMTLEASATAYATDSATGVTIKTGDASRTLVGMARTTASTAWADSAAQRFTLSYFNRRNIGLVSAGTLGVTTSSTVNVELTASARIEIVTWGEEAVSVILNGIGSNSLSNNSCNLAIGIDGLTVFGVSSILYSASGGNQSGTSASGWAAVAEGYHYFTPVGAVSGGTGTFNFALSAMIRG